MDIAAFTSNKGFAKQVQSMRDTGRIEAERPGTHYDEPLNGQVELATIQAVDMAMIHDKSESDLDPRDGFVKLEDDQYTTTAFAGANGDSFERFYAMEARDDSQPSFYKWNSNNGKMSKSLVYDHNPAPEAGKSGDKSGQPKYAGVMRRGRSSMMETAGYYRETPGLEQMPKR